MGMYFGTDGIRGRYYQELSPNLAFKTGNALAKFCSGKKVVIGKDTRLSSDVIAMSVANGLMSGGVDVVFVGVCPTPCVAYLTKEIGCDYGVMISASHNPPIYNGIKIFDRFGFKIDDEFEKLLEQNMTIFKFEDNDFVGHFFYKTRLVKKYVEHLLQTIPSLEGLTVAMDLANGANYKIAKTAFNALGAKVVSVNDSDNGKLINENCGALYPDRICKLTVESGAQIGITLDGDADRILVCDENGTLYDGDKILYILASHYGYDRIVGTTMSNKGFENALNEKGITLLRTDVGDKYVIEKMREFDIKLGGEPSGHIILKDFSSTGDGLLCGLKLASIIHENNKKLADLIDFTPYPQVNINVVVTDKFRILNNEGLTELQLKLQKEFGKNGRVIIRASGTEPKIRIMCEHINQNIAQKSAEKIKDFIENIDN